MPLVRSDWRMSWAKEVLCYDFCPEDRGYCSAEWTDHHVKSTTRVSERCRFKRRFGGLPARESALRRLDPFNDPATVITKKPSFDEADVDWEPERDFPEVDARLMLDTEWTVHGFIFRQSTSEKHVLELNVSVSFVCEHARMTRWYYALATILELRWPWGGSVLVSSRCFNKFVAVLPVSLLRTWM